MEPNETTPPGNDDSEQKQESEQDGKTVGHEGIPTPPDVPTEPSGAEAVELPKMPPIDYALALAVTEDGGLLFLEPKLGQKRKPSDEQVMAVLMRAQYILQRNMIFGGIEGSISVAMQTAASIGAQAAADYLRGAAKGIIVPR